jgi:hypothetical protein
MPQTCSFASFSVTLRLSFEAEELNVTYIPAGSECKSLPCALYKLQKNDGESPKDPMIYFVKSTRSTI